MSRHYDKYRRYMPYALAYVLGIASWWSVSEIQARSYDAGTAAIAVAAPESATERAPQPAVAKAAPTRQARQAGTASLRAAAAKGDRARVKRLLAAKARLDGADAQGRTALFMAAGGGHADVVPLLIGAGTGVERAPWGGETPGQPA